MPVAKTQLVTKNCVVCDAPFLVCPPGKTSRSNTRSFDARYCSRKCRNDARYRRSETPCGEITPTQAAYIAGFLDGEGSIILFRRRAGVVLRVSFSNSYLPVLEWLKETTKTGTCVTTKTRRSDIHKPGHLLSLNTRPAYMLLKQIVDYLIIKKEQALLAIEFYDKLEVPALKADKSWQYEYQDRMKALNKRGVNSQP